MELLVFFGFGSLAVVFVLVLQLDVKVRQLEKRIQLLEGGQHPAPIPGLEPQTESTPSQAAEIVSEPVEIPTAAPPPVEAAPSLPRPAVAFRAPDAAFWDRAIGFLGIGVLILGIGFGIVYAGLVLDALGRFFLLIAVSLALFAAGWLTSRKDFLKDLGLWLRSAGGALILLATLGAGHLEGLKWVDSSIAAFALLAVGLTVNLALGWVSRLTPITTLHQILGIVALALAEKNEVTLITAAVVSLAALVLAGFRRSPGGMVAGGLAFTAFLIFWAQGQEGVPTLFSVESAAFAVVYGSTLTLLAHRNESFTDGGRAASVILILGALVTVAGGYVVFRDLRLFTPLFAAIALLAGSSFGLRRRKVPPAFLETLGSLALFSVLAALAFLPFWDQAIPILPLVLVAGFWCALVWAFSSRFQLTITRLVALVLLPLLNLLLLPFFYEGLSRQLAHPVLLMLPALALIRGEEKEAESLYVQLVSGAAFLVATLASIPEYFFPWSLVIPALWLGLAVVADVRRKVILSAFLIAAFVFSSLIYLPAYADSAVYPVDSFPHLAIFITGFWWMGRGVLGRTRWFSSLAGAVVSGLAFYVILEKWSFVLKPAGVLAVISVLFVILEALAPLIRQRPIWGLDEAQLRVWRLLSESAVLFFALTVHHLVTFEAHSPMLWLWGGLLAASGAIWRSLLSQGSERLSFAAFAMAGWFLDRILPESIPYAVWLASSSILALAAWRIESLKKPLGGAAVGLFYLGLLAWLLLASGPVPFWPYPLVSLAGGLGFCAAALYGKTPLPPKYAAQSSALPLVGVAFLVLGLRWDSGAPSLLLLFLGIGLYLLALVREGAIPRITAFVALALTALRLLLVDFSEGDFGVRALVFLVSGAVLTGLSLFARILDHRRKQSIDHQG